MAFKQFSCPSCGAALELEYRFSEMVICGYCNQTCHLSGDSIEAKGEKIKLSDYGSKFHIGATGSVLKKDFKILGRIRFQYPDGFWDKWLVRLDKNPDIEYWLQEDEGDYTFFEKTDILPEISNFKDLKVGEKYALDGGELFISEKNTAQIVGGEGELPHRVIPGEQADFVDGIIYGKGMQTSLEFMPLKKQFYTTKHKVKLNDFIFTQKDTENGY